MTHTTEDHDEATRWNDYRINFLTANDWYYDSPGCYIHRQTGKQFHPYEPVMVDDGSGTSKPVEQWRVLADRDEAPDPEQTHIERRKAFYEFASG